MDLKGFKKATHVLPGIVHYTFVSHLKSLIKRDDSVPRILINNDLSHFIEQRDTRRSILKMSLLV